MKSKTNISNTSNDELQFKSINSIKKIILYFSLIIPLLAIVFNKYFTEIAGELGGNLSLYSLFIIVITGPLFILFPNKISKLFMDIRPELGVFMGIVAITHGFYGVMGLFNYLESLESPIALPPIIWTDISSIAWYCGLIAVVITIPLLVTSNKYAIDKLGSLWFKIHKAIIFIVFLGIFYGSFIKGINRPDGSIAWDSIIQFISLILIYILLKYFANKKKNLQK